jgi:hypothetical protein
MFLVEKKRVLDLLGVRVQILDAGSRTAPVRVKIEGRFFDLASLLENVSLKGDASSTCMEPQGIVEDAVTRRRGLCEGSRQTDHAAGLRGPPSP